MEGRRGGARAAAPEEAAARRAGEGNLRRGRRSQSKQARCSRRRLRISSRLPCASRRSWRGRRKGGGRSFLTGLYVDAYLLNQVCLRVFLSLCHVCVDVCLSALSSHPLFFTPTLLHRHSTRPPSSVGRSSRPHTYTHTHTHTHTHTQVAAYEEALVSKPNDPDTLYNYGTLFMVGADNAELSGGSLDDVLGALGRSRELFAAAVQVGRK